MNSATARARRLALQLQEWPRSRWKLVHWAAAGVVLAYVWRIASIFAPLRIIEFVSLTSLAAIGLFVVTVAPARMPKLLKDPIYRLALLILVLMVLSVPFGIYPGFSFRFIIQDHIKTFLAFTVLAGILRSTKLVRSMVFVVVFGGLIYCAKVLTSFEMQGGRLHGLIYYDSNDLGMLLVGTLPLAVYIARSKKVHPALRVLAAIAAVTFLVTFVRTGSRGAFLGMITVLAFLMWTWRSVAVGKRIAVAGTIIVALLTLAPSSYWESMSTLTNPTEDYNWSGNSPAGRMEVWKRGFGYMAGHPILGVGANAFWVAEGKLSEIGRERRARNIGMKWSAPHNSFIQAGAELGVPGLITYIALLWLAFSRSLGLSRKKSRAPPQLVSEDERALGEALGIAIVGYTATAFFLTQAYSAYLYVLLSMIVGLTLSIQARTDAYRHAVANRPETAGAGMVPGALRTARAEPVTSGSST